jgi:ADP-ribose pyrophosphatase YjhB (NUDIX family)
MLKIIKHLYFLILRLRLKFYNYRNVPKASLSLLINKEGKILSVSRKDNIFDKNIVGGKVDEGETFEQAAVREAKEETGLDIFNLKPVFMRKDGKFICVTFLAEFIGEIEQTEKGAIEWINYDELFSGSFGKYNSELKNIISKYHLAYLHLNP